MKENDVVCVVKNSATLAGSLFTLHASQVHIELPTLSDKDKEVNSSPADLLCHKAFITLFHNDFFLILFLVSDLTCFFYFFNVITGN